MKRIIYSNLDGSVSVVVPSPDYSGTMADLAISTVPNGAAFSIVEHTEIPTDRTFRNAWEYDASAIVIPATTRAGRTIAGSARAGVKVNAAKAKNIWRDKWREARKALLVDLDAQSLRAQEDNASNADKKAIRDAKQALRDITLTALPDDPDGIKAVWPSVLGNKPN